MTVSLVIVVFIVDFVVLFGTLLVAVFFVAVCIVSVAVLNVAAAFYHLPILLNSVLNGNLDFHLRAVSICRLIEV